MAKFAVIPHDSVLNAQYEALNANQKKFAVWLIEERNYNPYYAIETAAKVQKWSYTEGTARSEKVTRIYESYKDYLKRHDNKKSIDVKDVVRFKNFLKQYYELNYVDRMKVFGLVSYDWSPEKAIKKYEEALWLIDYFYNDRYLQDYTQNQTYDYEAFKRLGEAMVENDLIYIEDCPERFRKYLDYGLMAIDEYENILEIKNPDNWENDFATQCDLTYYFYQNDGCYYEDYDD